MSLGVDLEIERWNQPLPRYTSYPTAVQFISFNHSQASETYSTAKNDPLSLYLHIPFCRSMCLFCACSVILNRREDIQTEYVDLLCEEIRLVAALFPTKRFVTQVHFGGGTPTLLTSAQFDQIFQTIHACFQVVPEAEISVEADPRTVFTDQGALLAHLYTLGCNRLSFGVQDLDATVQEAVRRRQSEAMVAFALTQARKIGYASFHCDLIYGLPFQTDTSFARTIERMIAWRPNRISLFSYAKVPWLKPHQKAMPEEAEPSPADKWNLFLKAREALLHAGYLNLGMDHFVLAEDSLALALPLKKVQRNFQGYSLKLSEELVGIGISAIGYVNHTYLQNSKDLTTYKEAIQNKQLPVQKGLELTQEDLQRAWIIQEIMCYGKLEKQAFEDRFGLAFDDWATQRNLSLEEWFEQDAHLLRLKGNGKLLVRWAASLFDAYLKPRDQCFSKAL